MLLSVGYRSDNPHTLESDLRAQHLSLDVTRTHANAYGVVCEIERPIKTPGSSAGRGKTEMAVAGSDGSFAIAGLLPGTYLVQARSTSESEFASTEVVVGGSDVTGVTLTLSKGATARGRIRFDTGNPPQGLRPSRIFVMPIFEDPHMRGMDMNGGPPVARDDWSFELHGLRGRGFIRAGTVGDWEMTAWT